MTAILFLAPRISAAAAAPPDCDGPAGMIALLIACTSQAVVAARAPLWEEYRIVFGGSAMTNRPASFATIEELDGSGRP